MRRSIVADFITHVATIFADVKALSLRPLRLCERWFSVFQPNAMILDAGARKPYPSVASATSVCSSLSF